MENENMGPMQALIVALLGVVLALAGPYALANVEVPWQRIVLLSLLVITMLLLVAAFVLAIVTQIYVSYAPTTRENSRRRLLLLSNAFLLATVGAGATTAIFSYVLAIVRMV